MKRSTIKTDLYAGDKRRENLDALGEPLVFLERHVDFAALASEVDRVVPRPTSENGGGRPPYPTETMVRILILKRLHNLSDEQIEYQLLDRMSCQRFCGLTHSASIPDRNSVCEFENRIGLEGAAALFEAVRQQLERHGSRSDRERLLSNQKYPQSTFVSVSSLTEENFAKELWMSMNNKEKQTPAV